jgi:hypothetical protein
MADAARSAIHPMVQKSWVKAIEIYASAVLRRMSAGMGESANAGKALAKRYFQSFLAIFMQLISLLAVSQCVLLLTSQHGWF